MKTKRLLAHSLRAMARFRLRSAFMMLGSLIGVAALTLTVSIGQAAERKILATVRQLFGASSIMVSAGGGLLLAGPRSEGARMTLDDVEALARAIPAIETWDPQQIIPEASVRRGNASAMARVLGQSERAERVWNRGVSAGEFFDASAVAGSARVALIGQTVVRDLFGAEDPIGADILVGPVSLRVIGILEPLGTDAHGMDRDNEVVVPISTAMRRLMNVDTVRGVKLLVRSPGEVETTAREVERILRERHALAAGQPNDFELMTAVQVQKMVARVQRILFLFLPLVGGVSLLAAAVVSASLMLASVNERIPEIGLRRALGARPVDIRNQFLLESAVTTFAGGLVGIALGCVVGELVAGRMHLGDVLSWRAIILGVFLSAVTGLVGGVVPARRAALLRPVDALR